MGHAGAAAAADRGAGVHLITTAPFAGHAGVDVRQVESAEEMLAALRDELGGAQLLVMVAAVADYRPARPAAAKIRREDRETLELRLEKNVDILAELSHDSRAEGVFRIGFAAEDADLEQHAAEKLARKKLDAIVANDVRSGVFGSDENAGVMFFRTGERLVLEHSSKRQMADRILDAVRERLP
jgi:phosphopantothenoylcysteine decarboxylase/phosphopantothenate--cysteine ligase